MNRSNTKTYINLHFFTRLFFGASIFLVILFFYFYTTGEKKVDTDAEEAKMAEVNIGEEVLTNKKEINLNEFIYLEAINRTAEEFVLANPKFILTTDNTIRLRSGIYIFNDPIIIPKGTLLEIMAGTTIYLNEGAVLFSYSPIEAIGTEFRPISFIADQDKVAGNVVIVGADGLSIFDYTIFKNAFDGSLNRVFFSGMLAIQHADSIVRNSVFENANGDDALNIKYASSSIAFNTFINNSADAIDFDLGRGVIEHNRFVDNGNDAIDTSGSSVLIQHNDIYRSGDKCMSIGEKSSPIIFNNVMDGCKIGLEAKDLSTPVIINNVIINNQIGINQYQKKEFFGGGQAKVFNTIIWDNDVAIELDKASTIEVTRSAVAGDYKGNKNFNKPPIFVNAYNRDFSIDFENADVKYGQGDSEVLQKYLGINLSEGTVGLLSNN
jgi:preprotein translocase subunit YajC